MLKVLNICNHIDSWFLSDVVSRSHVDARKAIKFKPGVKPSKVKSLVKNQIQTQDCGWILILSSHGFLLGWSENVFRQYLIQSPNFLLSRKSYTWNHIWNMFQFSVIDLFYTLQVLFKNPSLSCRLISPFWKVSSGKFGKLSASGGEVFFRLNQGR